MGLDPPLLLDDGLGSSITAGGWAWIFHGSLEDGLGSSMARWRMGFDPPLLLEDGLASILAGGRVFIIHFRWMLRWRLAF